MSGYKWVPRTKYDGVPDKAVVGGRDVDGCTIYVGRANHENDMLPAKVIPEKNVAYVSYGGEEHPKYDYEILVPVEFRWEFAGNGDVPANAVEAGCTDSGEPLYVGRTFHNGSQTVGKIQCSHNCLYIPFDGEELSFRDYEVLVVV
ncbi:natterin-3 [Augochlora pura]